VTRNQHHRERDHFGWDLDTSVVTTSGVGDFPEDTTIHDVLSGMYDSMVAINRTAGLSLVVDGFSVPILSGNKGWVEVPFYGTITSVKMFVDQICNITVDIWKSTYATYPPIADDSICGSVHPSIASSGGLLVSELGSGDNPLTGWDTSLVPGDILWFHVDSNDQATLLTISITIEKPQV
jgi:hypothetical protein